MRTERALLKRYCRLLYEEGLVTGSEGNLSVRCGEHFLITPSSRIKKFLKQDEFAVVELSGRVISGRPSSEYLLHREVYVRREDAGAVVHAHPPCVLALQLKGFDFKEFPLPEAELFLGTVKVVEWFPPGTKELAEAVAEAALEAKVLILERHGTVTFGRDLEEAANLSLILEKVCRITLLSRL